MTAEIITIGDEILNGQIVDTNSAWMATQLGELHIRVVQITSIADTSEAITKALNEAEKRVDIIIVTGGLGPTKDDVTKSTVTSYFKTTLVRNHDVLAHVQQIFERAGYADMPEINKQQADVLALGDVLFNDVGTAPGMAVEHNGKYFAFLPGVPFEMKFLMERRVLPALKARQNNAGYIHNAYVLTVGIGESHLAKQIADIEERMPSFLKLAYLPQLGMVRLRFTAIGHNLNELIVTTSHVVEQVQERLGNYVVALRDISFEELIIETFHTHQVLLSTAESCTGGQIASRITRFPGASDIFQGSAVTYSNQAKIDLLGVDKETLIQHGAVSEQTVKEMAEGAKKVFHADYAIATSGIAGPGGGTATKPVGMICIAVAGKLETVVKTYYFKNDRIVNIERSVIAGLTLLWNLFQKESQMNRNNVL